MQDISKERTDEFDITGNTFSGSWRVKSKIDLLNIISHQNNENAKIDFLTRTF